MNDFCCEYSQDDVYLNRFDRAFVHKEVKCTNKIEIKNWLQHRKKILSLPGNYI